MSSLYSSRPNDPVLPIFFNFLNRDEFIPNFDWLGSLDNLDVFFPRRTSTRGMTCLGELVWIGLELDEFLRRRDRLGLRPDPSFGDRYGLSQNEDELDVFAAFCLISCGRGRFGELGIVLFSPDMIF